MIDAPKSGKYTDCHWESQFRFANYLMVVISGK